MALNGSIVITTRVDSGQATKDLESLIGRVQKLEDAQNDAAKAAANQADQTSKLASASNAAGIAMGVFGAAMAAAAVGSIKLAADLEQSRVAFTTLLGSGEKAKKFLDELAAFAASTPFEFKDLQDSSRRLLAFGFAAKDIIPIMNAVGSAVAGLGGGKEQIDRVTLALGQMQAKGKVSAEEMNQIAELGVPGWQMIASAIGKSIPEAMKLAEKGAIDSTTAINALITGMNAKFPGMLEKQSQTINGQLSNLRDGVTLTATLIGEKLTNAFHIADAVGAAARAVSGFAQMVKTGGLGEALETMFPPGLRAVLIGVAGAITASLVPALGALAVSFGAATVAAGPFLAIGAGIGAAAYLIMQNWEPVSTFFYGLFDNIAKMADAFRDRIVNALGGAAAQFGGSGRTAMRMSQGGASIAMPKPEKAVASGGFKNLLDQFMPNFQKIMNTTVTTVANTAFTGLSGKAADTASTAVKAAGEKASKTAEKVVDDSKKLEMANRARQAAQDRNDAAERLRLERQALQERERLERETQQRTASGLREAYGVALNLLRGDFEGVAGFFRGKLEEGLVNALSKSPDVQNAIAQLGSAFTGPLGIAALFGSLLISSIMSAGATATKIAREVRDGAEAADRVLNPEKYKNENPAYREIDAAVKQAEKQLQDAEDAYMSLAPAHFLTLGTGLFGVGDAIKKADDARDIAAETLRQLRIRLGETPRFNAPGTPGYTSPDVVFIGGRPVMRSDLKSTAQDMGIIPTPDKPSEAKPAAMPGETPDKPIYTQVVNVRDFRDAFPDSAYFRAPSVDTTRSLNANAVAYR